MDYYIITNIALLSLDITKLSLRLYGRRRKRISRIMKYKKNQKKVPMAKKHGLPKEVDDLNFTQLMYLQKVITKMEKDMRKEFEQEERKFALKFLIYVMVNVMSGEGYWEKTYMKRIPKLFEDMTELLKAIGDNVVMWEEVENLAHEAAGGFDIDDDLIERIVESRGKWEEGR